MLESAFAQLKELVDTDDRAANYFGIINEIRQTLIEDGSFAATVKAIDEELDNDVNIYTSLEWHTTSKGLTDSTDNYLVDAKYNDWRGFVVCYFSGGVFATGDAYGVIAGDFNPANPEHEFSVLKWALLPNRKEDSDEQI